MSVVNTHDLTQRYKQGVYGFGVYNINLEVSGWDTVNFQVLAPIAAPLAIYGSLNDGMSQGSLYPSGQQYFQSGNYGANRVRDWSAIQAINLATGSATSTISSAGIYSVPVNFPYLRLGASGANVYGLFQHNIKIQ